MFPNSSSGLSLVKVLSGVSKSLNIVKEVVPIYQQVKPMASKTMNFISKYTKNSPIKKVTENKPVTKKASLNNPSFFV